MASLFKSLSSSSQALLGIGGSGDKAAAAGGGGGGASERKDVFDLSMSREQLKAVEDALRQTFQGLGSPVSNEADRKHAAQVKASLMFGEIHFNGVNRIMDRAHLDAASARSLYDLGSGCGRLCVQVFLQFPNLEKVVGAELTSVRSNVGFTALRRLAQLPALALAGCCQRRVTDQPALTYSLQLTPNPGFHAPPRRLELRQINLFDCQDAWEADILICETNIDNSMLYDFLQFLSHCKSGCRLLTYNNLETMHEEVCKTLMFNSSHERKTASGGSVTERRMRPPFHWRRLAINTWDDKFETSWGMIRFHLYTHEPPPAASHGQLHAATLAAPLASPTASPSHSSSFSSSLASPVAFSNLPTPRTISSVCMPSLRPHEADDDELEGDDEDEPSSSP